MHGPATMACGLCVVFMLTLIGVGYIHYGATVPDTCESDMGRVFMGSGVVAIATSILALLGTCAAKEFFSAQASQALVQKWANDPDRESSAEEEQEEYDSRMACTARTSAFLACLTCILVPFSIGWKICGIVQALKGTNENCDGAITVWWVLLLLGVCSSFGQCGKQGNTQAQTMAS